MNMFGVGDAGRDTVLDDIVSYHEPDTKWCGGVVVVGDLCAGWEILCACGRSSGSGMFKLRRGRVGD